MITKHTGRLFALLAALVLALSLSACGSDDEEGGGGEGGGAKGTSGEAKQGGEITIAQTSQPDFLDPATSYTVNGWEPMWLVYVPLLAYPHKEGAEGATLIPGAAEALPEVSPDGKTYTFKLRKGLKYSDGTPAKASDFERTIQRILNLESGGSPFFMGIVGAEEYTKAKDPETDIEGITPDDATGEIVVKLKEPDGTFQSVIATNFGGLVPADTPFKNLTKTPPPGLGPYQITKSVPNREFVMERNPNFNIPGIAKGNVDKITTKIVKSPQRQTQDVISGKLDFIQDPPPADLLPEVKSKYKDRYEEQITASTYYFFLNNRVKPFDKKEVREAVNYGIDKPALARLFGGLLAPGCNFLPPGLPGYEKIDPCPYGDPNAKPDIEKARQLIKDAGEEGTKLTVYGNNDDPTPKVTQAYASMLEQMGFKTEVKILDGGVYFQTIGDAKTKAQTGFANWFQDFPHPANFMFLVNGKTIQPTNNQNFGNVDDPEITAGIEKLKKEPDLQKAAPEWAALDKKLVEGAYVAPYGHRKLATFLSARMDFENCSLFHPLYNNDYASFCLK